MTTSNHQHVTEGLQVLTKVLAPYVAQELRAKFADDWWSHGVLGVLYEASGAICRRQAKTKRWPPGSTPPAVCD